MNNKIYVAGKRNYKFRAEQNFAYLACFTDKGAKVWETNIKGSQAVSIDQMSDNTIIVSGYTDKTDGNRDLWVAAFTNTGKKKWYKNFPAKGEAVSILNIQNKNIAVVAQYQMLILSSSGSLIKTVKFKDNYKAYKAKQKNGNIFISGRYYNFKEDTKSDFWLMKTNSSGNKIFSKTYNRNSLHDIATDLIINENGNITLIGSTSQEENIFYDDIWLLEVNSKGNKIKDYLYGGDQNEKYPNVIKIDNQLIIGGSKTYTSDIFLMKVIAD